MNPQTRSNCFLLTIAPMSDASSIGSPTFIAATLAANFDMNESKIDLCTNSRDPAVQDWPWRKKRMPIIAASTAQSSSASGKTICGFLPPSSRDTGMIRDAAAVRMRLPTAVEPVKDSLSTSGLLMSASPVTAPTPCTTLSTPGGRNSWQIFAISRIANGASSAVLSTRVLPATMAGAIFMVPSCTGAFHGMMAPTTPYGSRRE